MTRTVEGKTDKCAARFNTVAGTDRIPVLRIHFILTARSMTPPTAGNLILTITHDLRATFIFPKLSRPVSKRYFRGTSNRGETAKACL